MWWFISGRGVHLHHLQRNLQREDMSLLLSPSQLFLTLSRCFKAGGFDLCIFSNCIQYVGFCCSSFFPVFVDTTMLSPKQHSSVTAAFTKLTTISNHYYEPMKSTARLNCSCFTTDAMQMAQRFISYFNKHFRWQPYLWLLYLVLLSTSLFCWLWRIRGSILSLCWLWAVPGVRGQRHVRSRTLWGRGGSIGTWLSTGRR